MNCYIQIRAPAESLLRLLRTFGALLLFASGCVSIPTGDQRRDTSWPQIKTNEISRTMVLPIDMSVRIQDGKLNAALNASCKVVERVEESISSESQQEFTCIGLLPGFKSRIIRGVSAGTCGNSFSCAIYTTLNSAFANLFVFGLPTVFSVLGGGMSDNPTNRIPAELGLVGAVRYWGPKTNNVAFNRWDQTRVEKEKLPPVTLEVRIPAAGVTSKKSTDPAGRMALDLTTLPILTDTPLIATVCATELATPPAPIEIELPANLLGAKWRGYIEKGDILSLPPELKGVYLWGRIVDFSLAPPDNQVFDPLKITISTEVKRHKTSKNTLAIQVTNAGKSGCSRVAATVQSKHDLLDGLIIWIGRTPPGETVRGEVAVALPAGKYRGSILLNDNERRAFLPCRFEINIP